MIECKNCKFHSENKFNCNRVIGFSPDLADNSFYNGALYARPDRENKNNTCEFFKNSISNRIINFLLRR